MSLRRLFEELKRRHVFRVTGLYLIGAYAVIQAATTVFPLLHFPESAATAILIAAIVGLPVVVLLTWVFDITPEGIRRTVAADGEQPIPIEQQIEAHRRRFAAKAVGFVGVGILVALVGFAAYGRYAGFGGAGSKRIESVAVMPFADYSAARDQEYFTDGVTEELINRLTHIEGLRVAGRTSSFAFKGKEVPADQIGRQLQVQAVIDGSVRREGENVRVTVELVDAQTSHVIWSEKYDRKVSGVFALQDEIASAIVDALRLQLSPSAPELAKGERGTRNALAHDLYLKGLDAWNKRTDAQLRVALEYFERAAEADTTYALAYAGLAMTYAVLPSFGDFTVVDALRKGSAAAAQAIQLDPSLGQAHAALGQIAQNLEWDLTSAIRSYRRAVKFSPKDASAHQWYSEALMLTGDLPAAKSELDRALEIDPLSPSAKNVAAYQLVLSGDYPAALRAYQNLLRENPTFQLAQLNYALAAFAAKDYGAAAEATIAALPQHAPDVGVLIAAASGQGDRAAALSALQNIAAAEPPSVVALLYAAVGANDKALALLKSAFDSGNDANLAYVLVHPLLAPLRTNQQFQQMVRTVGVAFPA